MDEDRQTGTTQQENFKKKVAQDYKINHEFWSPASTFQWCFYGGNYMGIFWGSPIGLDIPDGAVIFTSLRKASSIRYDALSRLLRASVVQKVLV
jgi:hypothetical protein